MGDADAAEQQNMILIDGSDLEGGGQILRNAISLSALMHENIRITKIRAGRPKPGLAAQHLKGIELVAAMCEAETVGVNIGSETVEFKPGPRIKGGRYAVDVKTAGAVSLLLQVALPVALFADSPVILNLRGGTNVPMAPHIDYIIEVVQHYLKMFGAHFQCHILKRGFYPRGGGHVVVRVTPVPALRRVALLERGHITATRGWSWVSGYMPMKGSYIASEAATTALGYDDINWSCYKEDEKIAPDTCHGIFIVCETSSGCRLASSALLERYTQPMTVGGDAGTILRQNIEHGATVDQYLQDQLIIYMALADGKSIIRTGPVTEHTRTAIKVANAIAWVDFKITQDGTQNVIQCDGMGLKNKHLHLINE